jgi:hypothetical protein
MPLDPSTITQGDSAERTYIGHAVNAFISAPGSIPQQLDRRTGTSPHADRDELFEDFLTWMSAGAPK